MVNPTTAAAAAMTKRLVLAMTQKNTTAGKQEEVNVVPA
jgi:hypothetical protein